MLRTLCFSVAATALLGSQALAQTTTPPVTAPAQPTTAGAPTATTPAGPAQPAQAPAEASTPTTPATAAGGAFSGDQSGGTIFAALQGNPQFSTLVTALTTTNLDDVLNGTDRQYTLFAPTNAAFAALPEAQRTALMSNPQQLQALLLHHVVGTAVTGAQLRNERTGNRPLPMADNTPQALAGSGDTVTIGGATVTQMDIRASNGVIHVIDGVIMGATPAAAAAPATAPGASSVATPQG